MLFDNEPEIQPDDTKPTMTIPIVDAANDDAPQPRQRARLWGALSLIGALIFTVGTVALLLTPSGIDEKVLELVKDFEFL